MRPRHLNIKHTLAAINTASEAGRKTIQLSKSIDKRYVLSASASSSMSKSNVSIGSSVLVCLLRLINNFLRELVADFHCIYENPLASQIHSSWKILRRDTSRFSNVISRPGNTDHPSQSSTTFSLAIETFLDTQIVTLQARHHAIIKASASASNISSPLITHTSIHLLSMQTCASPKTSQTAVHLHTARNAFRWQCIHDENDVPYTSLQIYA